MWYFNERSYKPFLFFEGFYERCISWYLVSSDPHIIAQIDFQPSILDDEFLSDKWDLCGKCNIGNISMRETRTSNKKLLILKEQWPKLRWGSKKTDTSRGWIWKNLKGLSSLKTVLELFKFYHMKIEHRFSGFLTQNILS